MDGWQYERKCAEYLKKLGFSKVEVTKGSGDFGVDILAIKKGLRYAIQCKYYESPIGNKAIQEVYAGMSYYRCNKAMVITNSTYTRQAKQLAASLNVELIENVTPIDFVYENNVNHEPIIINIQRVKDGIGAINQQMVQDIPYTSDSTNLLQMLEDLKQLVEDYEKYFIMTANAYKEVLREYKKIMILGNVNEEKYVSFQNYLVEKTKIKRKKGYYVKDKYEPFAGEEREKYEFLKKQIQYCGSLAACKRVEKQIENTNNDRMITLLKKSLEYKKNKLKS
ncbi:restriction endonuclease [Pseudobutyrivibrio ruminis]|uniref:Restriction endonuclease type IV Mrr domain-containing protein n=1 Tax=Pseudobutyrivibrio ruminis TaxID=46206 RepID=A0A2G3DT29_9FIRM|nr:restriction endonuclease [Pseudobutyrivibrio ruminis]PHU34121.1 hypothetical protein CSX01_11165 [Pseudobutyrivibrio ruminis]